MPSRRRRLFRLPIALLATALLLAVFSLATAAVLVLAGPRGNEWGTCTDDANPPRGLMGAQPLEVRQRYDYWEARPSDIKGPLPHRTCRLYASKSATGPYLLVAKKDYPGDTWYPVGLLIIAAPLLLFGARRAVQSLQR